jgi:hypothetical protein
MDRRISRERAGLFSLALLAAVAWLPHVIDPAMAPRWAVLAVFAPIVLLLIADRIPAPLGGAGAAVLVMIAATLQWTPAYFDGVDELTHLLILATVFCIGAAAQDLRAAWAGLALGVTVSAALAIAQVAGYTGIEQVVVPAGLFMNKNLLAEAGLVALIPAVMSGAWLLAIGPAIAVLLGASKAVCLALVIVLIIALWQRSPRVARAGVGLLALTALGWLALGDYSSVTNRLPHWQTALSDPVLLGHGLGAFADVHPLSQYAHSEYLQLVYEFGLLAIAPAALLAYILNGADHEAERLVVLAILVVGLFAFPLRMPLTGFAFALAAGHLAAGRAGLRGQFDRCAAADDAAGGGRNAYANS